MDPKLDNLVSDEFARQERTIDLIPSENIAPPEVLELLGSHLTNKYSEGYPGKRYYPGNMHFDAIEELASERALAAFDLGSGWAVNVQPYSGSPAIQAVYFALAKPNDVVMGLKLSHGGHLTHGHHVSFSGIVYHSVHYGLNEKTGKIDYAELEQLARQHKPRIIVSGATAYPREINFAKISKIARAVGAYHVADISHIAGLVAAKLHPAPFSHADVVVMTTHKTLRGPRGAAIFSRTNPFTGSSAVFKSFPKKQQEGVSISDLIDRAVFPGLQGGPHNNVTAAIAWTFGEAATPRFVSYQRQIQKNAAVLADTLSGLGFKLISGGTDTHLMLVNLGKSGIDAMAAERMLESAGIVANRNTVPGDESAFHPSGLRIGTPSVTSRGMREKEMKQIGGFIYQVLVTSMDTELIRRDVETLCKKFPLPYGKNRKA